MYDKKVQILKETKQLAKSISKCCDLISKGYSEVKSCKECNLSVNEFRFISQKAFNKSVTEESDIIKKKSDNFDYLASGKERLLAEVCGYVTLDMLEHFDEAYSYCRNILKERERIVLDSHYIEEDSLVAIGKTFGVTGDRVKQISLNAIRKLRKPEIRAAFEGGVDFAKRKELLRTESINLLKDKKELEVKLRAVQKERSDIANLLQDINKKCDDSCMVYDLTLNDILEKYDISMRLYNCLRIAGISKVSDFEKYTKEDLANIRHLGRKSYNELLDCLSKLNVVLKDV